MEYIINLYYLRAYKYIYSPVSDLIGLAIITVGTLNVMLFFSEVMLCHILHVKNNHQAATFLVKRKLTRFSGLTRWRDGIFILELRIIIFTYSICVRRYYVIHWYIELCVWMTYESIVGIVLFCIISCARNLHMLGRRTRRIREMNWVYFLWMFEPINTFEFFFKYVWWMILEIIIFVVIIMMRFLQYRWYTKMICLVARQNRITINLLICDIFIMIFDNNSSAFSFLKSIYKKAFFSNTTRFVYKTLKYCSRSWLKTFFVLAEIWFFSI